MQTKSANKLITDALKWAFTAYQPAIKLQKELAKKVSPVAKNTNLIKPNAEVQKAVDEWVEGKLGDAIRKPYAERNELVSTLRWAFHEEMAAGMTLDEYAPLHDEYDEAFTSALHTDVRKGIIEDGIRPDGRKFDEIRPLSSEVGFLPRAHGSSLFARGLTQAMNIVTLAPLSFAQIVDTMENTDMLNDAICIITMHLVIQLVKFAT